MRRRKPMKATRAARRAPKKKARARRRKPTEAMLAARRAAKKYERGILRYQERLELLKLPPRGPRGSEQNYARVGAVAAAMHGEKLTQ